MSEPTVLYTEEDGIAVITLNRPDKLNALTNDMVQGIADAVAEAAVVASPDPDRGSIVKAFVRLTEGHEGSGNLTTELQEHVKTNLAAYKYPREIEYVSNFELTSSGKISRKKLRESEVERKGIS